MSVTETTTVDELEAMIYECFEDYVNPDGDIEIRLKPEVMRAKKLSYSKSISVLERILGDVADGLY
jgi:hypothetical protein